MGLPEGIGIIDPGIGFPFQSVEEKTATTQEEIRHAYILKSDGCKANEQRKAPSMASSIHL